MRDRRQVEQAGQLGVVGQVIGEATVVEAQELLDHQATEELGLGEFLGAVDMAVVRDGLASGVVGDLEDPDWRFAGGHIS